MQQKLNNLLEKYLQIRLTRVRRPLSIHSSGGKKGNNLIVEFIGPSCVGKSTLYYHHLEHNQLNEVLKVIHGRKFRKNWNRYLKSDKSHFNKFHKQLLADKFNFNAKRSVSGLRKFESIKHFNLLLEIDSWIETHLVNQVIVFDEHLFGRLYKQQPEREEFNTFLANRCFINCRAPAEFHFNNVIKRRKAGTKPVVYEGLSEAGIYKKIKSEQAINKSLLVYFEKRNVPVLNLNIADGVAHNCQLIDDFIKGLAEPLLNNVKEEYA